MPTPSSQISVLDVHSELARSFVFYVPSQFVFSSPSYFVFSSPSYGVRFATSTTTPMEFHLSTAFSSNTPGPYRGFPFRLQENEPIVYTREGGAQIGNIPALTPGVTYYIRDIVDSTNSSTNNGCSFRLSTTPGGPAILGNAANILTAGYVTFTRPLLNISLNDAKSRYLANLNSTGTSTLNDLKSKNRASIIRTQSKTDPADVVRRHIFNEIDYNEINTGTSGILTRCPAYSGEFNFDATDFYFTLDTNRFDTRASNQIGNMTITLDFSYNTSRVDSFSSVMIATPFLRPTGYSADDYPSNAIQPTQFANPGWDGETRIPFRLITNFTDSGGYRRGTLTWTKPLATASGSSPTGWSYGCKPGENCYNSVNRIGWWNIGTLTNAAHMVSFYGLCNVTSANIGVDAWRIYGASISLTYGL